MSIIHCENLSKTFKVPKKKEGLLASIKHLFNAEYDDKEAVKNLTCKIEKGEIVGLLGPNGAGKSTTIKMLTGILKPSSGSVECLGLNPYEDREQYVHNIGALFGQKNQLWWDLPAMDTFRLSQKLYEIPKDVFVQRRDELISLLDAEGIVDNPVRNLSLGERMKCEFITAFLHNPDLVFLDEPTIGVDAFTKENIRTFIKEINERYGTTIIITTHDMEDIDALAERVIVISDGKKVFDDKIASLRSVLGNISTVEINTENKVALERDGVELLGEEGTEYTVQVDKNVCSVQDFINLISEQSRIIDLRVSEPDIESIIKVVYNS